MSWEDFHLGDNETIENTIIERDFLKVYHQQGALLNNPGQNVEFIIGENDNYLQAGNSHLEFDITVRKARGNNFNFTKDAATKEVVRVVKNSFAFCFKEGTLAANGGMEIEQVNLLGLVSTIITALTSSDDDLLSHVDNIDETQNGGNITLLEQMLINNHTDANRGKIKGHLPLGHIHGFCKTSEKITKNIGFQLTFRTIDLQGILFTTLGDDIIVTIKSLYLFVPVKIPITKIQVIFIESIKDNYTITYDSWYTERKLSTDGNELQVDIGSAQNVKSPKNLIGAFQTLDTVGAHSKNNNVAISDNVNV